MNKGLRKVLILLAVFIAAVCGFSRLTNHETKNLTADMAAASLPVVYLDEGGNLINELHGYTDEMDAVSVRDTITPLGEDGMLPVQIDCYGKRVKELSFEVRSLDTQRLIQDTAVEDFENSGGQIKTKLQIQDMLEDDEEYLLVLKLKISDVVCRYYTRIIRGNDTYIRECLDFVKDFHAMTMDKNRREELAPYMEPSPEGDNTTLQKVTINSNLKQACWGDFEGEEVTEPVASIKELNEAYNVILLNYILTAQGEDGEAEYYNVEEYYRVRQGAQRIHLLSFERTMEEIFRGEGGQIQSDKINLGIRSGDVDFQTNEAGNVVCFVQQGELWSYRRDDNDLVQVFSFRSREGMDVRENYNEHDIRIIRSDENGSVDFIVYGYMNRGGHEGQVGISVCHYDYLSNTVEEELFLPARMSYQMMKEEIGRIMYISDGGVFYLTVGDQVHRINLETMQESVLLSGLIPGAYTASENGRYLAWTDQVLTEAQTMHLTDLETEATSDIPAGEGYLIRPLGFVGSDCIYGLADSADVRGDTYGGKVFAMKRVQIISAAADHSVLKTYESDGNYVTGADVRGGSVYLSRVRREGNVYVETEGDTVMNRDMQEDTPVSETEEMSERKQREVILQFEEEYELSKGQFLIPRQILKEESTTLQLSEYRLASTCYVYAKGKILLATDDVVEAIRCADENRGVVIGENQSYIWKRGKQTSRSPIPVAAGSGSFSSARALSSLLSTLGKNVDVESMLQDGQTPAQILAGALPDRHTYDLCGCSMDQALYFVGLGIPVYAQQSDGTAVLLTGYNETSVWVCDPMTRNTVQEPAEQASERFAEAGNIFYAAGE